MDDVHDLLVRLVGDRALAAQATMDVLARTGERCRDGRLVDADERTLFVAATRLALALATAGRLERSVDEVRDLAVDALAGTYGWSVRAVAAATGLPRPALRTRAGRRHVATATVHAGAGAPAPAHVHAFAADALRGTSGSGAVVGDHRRTAMTAVVTLGLLAGIALGLPRMADVVHAAGAVTVTSQPIDVVPTRVAVRDPRGTAPDEDGVAVTAGTPDDEPDDGLGGATADDAAG